MQSATVSPDIFSTLSRPDRSGAPKYMRLSSVLMQAITAGHWKAGDRLPTEEELAAMTPFSLGTVQRALRTLVDQGVVVRLHGLGSFVTENDLRMEDPWHCRFLDTDDVSFLPVYSKVLSRERIKTRGAWSRYFPDVGDNLTLITRVINVNSEFDVLVRFYMDSRILPRLSKASLRSLDGLNFKTVIVGELNVPITRITHDVSIVKFDAATAELIGTRKGESGLFMRAAAMMGETACVYYQEFSIPATNRVLSIPDQLPRMGHQSR
ncbi:GntR family transcriptional regulator [Paraburkholderia sp. RL18-103-BIB-C]|jgi:DNA-binding GntR family transcriptional regulator|uniref:GntR family transcriptional regulator n=1 Tax=unclassified Paraburkholderia TaxID=2615204 RepID=UPI0038B87A38